MFASQMGWDECICVRIKNKNIEKLTDEREKWFLYNLAANKKKKT